MNIFKQTPRKPKKNTDPKKTPFFKQQSEYVRDSLFVLPGFKNSKEMKIAKNYGAFCNYCKRKVNGRFREIVVHMSRRKCIDFYRKNYQHLAYLCKVFEIQPEVSLDEAGPLLHLINNGNLSYAIKDTQSTQHFDEYRTELFTQLIEGDRKMHQDYIRTVKETIKAFMILHNIYTGAALDNQSK